MKIFKHKSDLKREIIGKKNLSFVPTMGSLHSGHANLIKKANKKTKSTIVSIFINPTQFNSKKDFLSYPRQISKDLNLLKKLKVKYVYMPSYSDIYGFNPASKIFLDKFSKQLCGKFRKNHFLGVVNVVNRLLDIIKPKYILLGKKDFQQLYLIKKHILVNKIKTTVVACSTVRMRSGIAYSSRNNNLNKRQLLIASRVYLYLKKQKSFIKKNQFSSKIRGSLRDKLKILGVDKIDYIKFLNLKTLKCPKSKSEPFNIFIAYHLSRTRLIDNF